MKINICAFMIACAVTPAFAAQGQLPPTFHYVSEGVSGQMSGSNSQQFYSVGFSETAQKVKNNKFEGGFLNFTFCLYQPPGSTGVTRQTCYNGFGSIPGDAITVQGSIGSPNGSVTVKVPDLLALPTFFVSGFTCEFFCEPIFTFPATFDLSVTLRATNLFRTESDGSTTIEQRLPDGTIIRNTSRGRSLSTTAEGTGVILGTVLAPSFFGNLSEQRNVTHTISISKPSK